MTGRTAKKSKATIDPAAVEPPARLVDQGFPIVGIGASAGGLAAFEAFFAGMPADADPGMAFVLVQHLAPDHKSILTDLIRRYTRMQVFEVEDGMAVQPNFAYIIPPNRDMAFLHGTLQLLEPVAPRGRRLPIDFFFRTGLWNAAEIFWNAIELELSMFHYTDEEFTGQHSLFVISLILSSSPPYKEDYGQREHAAETESRPGPPGANHLRRRSWKCD